MIKPFKKAALLDAMQYPEAKSVAQNASVNGFDYMVEGLQHHYHQLRILFPLHWKALTHHNTVDYTKKDMDNLLRVMACHCKSLNDIHADSIWHAAACHILQSFSPAAKEKWRTF